MTKDNKKLLTVGICALLTIISLIIIAIIINYKPSTNKSLFTSDNTKYVVTLEGNEISFGENLTRPTKVYAIYYYKNNTITNLETYYVFNQKSDAKAAYNYFNKDDSSDYKSITLDGNNLIITANKSEYQDKTPSEIRNYIEFLENPNSAKSDETEINSLDEDDESTNSQTDLE